MTQRINPAALARVIKAAKLAEVRARTAFGFRAGPTPKPGDEPTSYSRAVLGGLRSNVFQGINPDHPTKSTTKRVTARRTKNKQARQSRRANRH